MKESDFYKTLEFNNENTVQVKNKKISFESDVEHTEKNGEFWLVSSITVV